MRILESREIGAAGKTFEAGEAHFERTGVYGIMSEICFKGRSTSAAKGSGKDAQDFQIVYFENRKEGDRETARSASFGRFF